MTIKQRWPKGAWMTLRSAEILRVFMDEKDFTMARLARSAGCSRQFIWQLLRGQKKSMKPLTAARIAEALGVPLTILFAPSVAIKTDQIVKTKVAA